MNTRSPISTISYNTEPFLLDTLNRLHRAGIISEWYYIFHQPEDDESRKKEHFHLFLIPSKTIQTDSLEKEFIEIDPTNPKPRKTLYFVTSKFGPWYMYAIHDRRYLASKRQSRVHHYTFEDIVASDDDKLFARYQTIDLTAELGPYAEMMDAQSKGLTWKQFIAGHAVPIAQYRNWESAWLMLLSDETYRNGRPDHES